MNKANLRHLRFWSDDERLSALLAMLVLLIFVIYPLRELGVVGDVLMEVFLTLLLVSGVRSMTNSRKAPVVMLLIAAATIISGWLGLIYPHSVIALVRDFFAILFLASLVGVTLVEVYRKGEINFHRIQGAVAAYLLLGILWALSYHFLDLLQTGAFHHGPGALSAVISDSALMHRFIYFSFMTMTTLGYSEISAVSPFARSLVMVEALVGQLFPAILIAQLISMEVSSQDIRSRGSGSDESIVKHKLDPERVNPERVSPELVNREGQDLIQDTPTIEHTISKVAGREGG